MVKAFKDHKHYVQGVAWDPWDGWFATQSADRNVRLWRVMDKQKNNPASNGQGRRMMSLLGKINKTESGASCFYDESLVTFFRRLTFTPDGAYLLMPSGMDDLEKSKTSSILVLSRAGFGSLQQPVASLNGFRKPPVAIRCCPRLFQRLEEESKEQRCTHDHNSPSYRTIFAAASRSTINIYDTQHWGVPICSFSHLHYGTMTDLAWSADGRVLVMASQDGFCSIAYFSEGDLGRELGKEREGEVLADVKHRIHLIETMNSVASITIMSSDPIVDAQDLQNHPIANNTILPSTLTSTSNQIPAKRRLAPMLIGTSTDSTMIQNNKDQK